MQFMLLFVFKHFTQPNLSFLSISIFGAVGRERVDNKRKHSYGIPIGSP